jgi:adenosylcobinamide-GDP ribazoletransferase
MGLKANLTAALQQMGGAGVFYTCLPLPACLPLRFTRIAQWATGVGLIIGALLGLADFSLGLLQVPLLPRSALIVAFWIGLTGGLHLDGAMDTADGLAVMEPERRLEVMADSRSGAFGGMVAGIILLLKVCALSAIPAHRPLMLMLTAAWGRWGQMVAIAAYPYLKPEGKGAFHQHHLQLPWDFVPGLIVLMGLAGLQTITDSLAGASLTLIAAALLSTSIGLWFNHQLSGMTGDVYGAIVEWTEALLLCILTSPLALPINFT